MQQQPLERAWDDILRDPLPGRLGKPRRTCGLTMLIDTGIGLQETVDLIRLAGAYIDFIKLGFGTSKLYPTHVLQDKISLLQESSIEVYPGGTFLEAAVLQGKWHEFLLRCQRLGFRTIEVSDGTISLSRDLRRDIITSAKRLGFNVITEVGKKATDTHLPISTQLQMIQDDLEAGAYKVIIEGRESGKGVGLYDSNGNLLRDEFDELVAAVGQPEQLIWEAPIRSQQEELIRMFGPNVNLGNINPRDIIALEALRCGWRSDTLRLSL